MLGDDLAWGNGSFSVRITHTSTGAVESSGAFGTNFDDAPIPAPEP